METSPSGESRRLKVLRDLKILDTEAEREFDDLVKLAGTICGTSISLMSLIDDRRQWFKAKLGFEANETPREISFCHHTIQRREITVIEDASKDPRFADNPLVTGPEHIRFYAGSPIQFDGEAIGALCVKDSSPKTLTEAQRFGLETISNQIARLLEVRLQNFTLNKIYEASEEQKIALRKSNASLLKLTQDLSVSENDLRKSLTEINHLQRHLEMREKQYREIVETATDC